MKGFEDLVTQYQSEADAHLQNAELIHAAILFITLCLLVLEGRFIFLPTARAIEEKTAEISQSKNDIDYAALHDALTGLANRRLCQERLMEAVEDVNANGGRAAVLHIDLDGFKAVNDTLGHAAGDDVLSQVAGRLGKAVRESDTVARVGGDEFVVICPGHGSESDDEGVAERILEEFTEPFTLANNVRVDVGCSIGIGRYPGDAPDAEDLLIAADLALYRAKETGKHRYVLFDPTMRESFHGKIELAQRVKQAIGAGEFELFYQPQIDIESGQVVGVESLLRWRDPEHGLRTPGDFLEAIEHSGVSQAIGAFVIDRAIADAAGWHQEGINFGRIALNVTAAQLRDTDFIDQLLDRLLEHQLPPNRLAIEIVEGVVLSGHSQRLRTLLDELNDLEISIEFDDFGTGYASLTHLRELPVNRIKIDRSFISELPESEDHGNIVRGVINILQRLGLEVVAEGVERVEQAKVLNEWGCHCVQGYLFARPSPIDEVTKYLKLANHERSLAAVVRSLNGEPGYGDVPELSAAS